ncbi:hypothetical protein F5Y16DRAFT_185293 [Xylariaceae sp. FL0255]|nr:hypothetical protein F5Y16DRAFT_185293 [Xylariaceae sp. FL0255]
MPGAIDDAFHRIFQVIQDQSLYGKAVVTDSLTLLWRDPATPGMSGFDVNLFRALDDVWWRNLDKLEQYGILFVVAAGNQGSPIAPDLVIPTGDKLPHRFGTETNNIVTVGGVTAGGLLSPLSCPSGSSTGSLRGSINVYAQMIDVTTADIGAVPRIVEGTSFAAPAVAGLIAYALALPANAEILPWQGDGFSFAQATKKYIVDTAYRRVRMADQFVAFAPLATDYPYPPGWPYDIPQDVPVAYNNIWGPQTPCDNNNPAGGPGNADPRSPEYQCFPPPAQPQDFPLPLQQEQESSANTPVTAVDVPTSSGLTNSVATTDVPTATVSTAGVPASSSSDPAFWPVLSGSVVTMVMPTDLTSFQTGWEYFTLSSSISTPTYVAGTTTIGSIPTALPTQYYNASTAAGCITPQCMNCTEGFEMVCSLQGGVVECACQWQSGCYLGTPVRGDCDSPCSYPGWVMNCTTGSDPISYLNGYCTCVPAACNTDSDCSGTCPPNSTPMTCQNRTSNYDGASCVC